MEKITPKELFKLISRKKSDNTMTKKTTERHTTEHIKQHKHKTEHHYHCKVQKKEIVNLTFVIILKQNKVISNFSLCEAIK